MRRAGYGLAWGKDHPHNMAEPLRGPWQSSRRAELTSAVQMTLAEPSEPLLIRTDSAWTMAGGLLLLQGYRPDARWESGDLWRQWAEAISSTSQVFLQKVKAHVDESLFAQGIITRAEAEGNERADELAGFGRQQQGSTADEEQRAGVRERYSGAFCSTVQRFWRPVKLG